MFDGQAGLHYNYFRDYDPAIGQFIEGDPIGIVKDYRNPALVAALEMLEDYDDPNPDAINSVYAYVYRNPLDWSDDNGLEPKGGHTSNARPSTQEKHERGDSRRNRDQGNEKGDDRRPYSNRKRPKGWKGPWNGRGSFLPFIINPCAWAPQLMPPGSCTPDAYPSCSKPN